MDYQHDYLLYIAAFATAFGVSLFTTPLSKKLSVKVGAIDLPKKRGLHKEPIPRMGGIAIVLGFVISLLVLLPFLPELHNAQFLGFMVGALIIVGVGIVDDIKNLRARVKLVFQIIASLVVIYSGTEITFVTWPFTAYIEPFSPVVTLIWIVGVTNAVNLIDGVDGLAAGVTAISAVTIMVLCILSGSPLAVVLTASLAGSCMGFLPRNFSPAEVFMGDTGSTFLGFVLAVSSIIGVFKSYAILSVVLVACCLALPIFDTLFAIIRRTINKRPIMEADRGHLHHRLIDSGMSHRRAVVILYALSGAMGLISIMIAMHDLRALIVISIFIAVFGLMLFTYNKRI